jgi:hypothetical protein
VAISAPVLCLIALALTSCDPARPVSSAAPTPSTSPLSAADASLVAGYCVDAVDAIDSLALGKMGTFRRARDRLAADMRTLPPVLRSEAAELDALLNSEVPPEDITHRSRAAWRLEHTPPECVDIPGIFEQARRLRGLGTLTPPAFRPVARSSVLGVGAAPSSGHVEFEVMETDAWDSNCAAFGLSTAPRKALFTTACGSWNPAYDFFLVRVRSVHGATAEVGLDDFTLLDQAGAALVPVDVQTEAEQPGNYVSANEGVSLDAPVLKFIVFAERGVQPVAMALEEDEALLIDVFRGNVEPR